MNGVTDNILVVDKLITSFETDRGLLRAVDQVSFVVPEGKTVGIVGESGCGKSVTAMSIVRLLPQPSGKVLGGHVNFKGRDLLRASDAEMRKVRGGDIGVISRNRCPRSTRCIASAARFPKSSVCIRKSRKKTRGMRPPRC